MTYNGETFDVDIEAGINLGTGQVYATFFSLDPTTGLPPSNVLTGFLPPEDGTGRGMGYLSFIVSPKANLSTGTQIRNVADISFDRAQAIATDQVSDTDPTQGVDPTRQALVTIDAGPPTSSVTTLPTSSPSPFTVSWSGQGDTGGSGIASYNIYVSDNGGAYTLWQSDTTQTSVSYSGTAGQTYSFYSVATDNVGNVQATPTSAQATTTVEVPTTTLVSTNHSSGSTYGQAVTFTATVTPSVGTFDNGGSVQFMVDGSNFGLPEILSGGIATIQDPTLSAIGSPHTITATYSGDIGFGGSFGTLSGGQTVSPATLDITANSTSKTYGQTVTLVGTSFTTGAGELFNGNTVTSVTLTSAGSAGSATVAGSPYPIVPSAAAGTGLSNYTIRYHNGSLAVTPATLDITAKSTSKTYGQTVTLVGTAFTVGAGELLNGNTVTSVTLASAGAAGSATVAGSPYPIVPSAAAGTGLSNYTIRYHNGSLAVTPAALDITANSTSKTYGQTVTLAGTAFTTGTGELFNGDKVTTVTLTSAGTAASATVGSYPIVPSAAVGTGLGNYTINYHNGLLTVTGPTLADADMVVSTSGQKTAVSGRDVIYQINVTNYGPGTAQNVVVTDTLPAGTQFVSATSSNAATVSGNGTTVTVSLSAPMGVGASETIIIDAIVKSNVATGTTLTNNVTVTTPTAQAQAKGCPSPVGCASFTTRINMNGVSLVPSMQTPGMMDLVITDGPASSNTIMVLPSGCNDMVMIDGRVQGAFACTGRIVVYGDDNDYEWISPSITKSAWLYGGSGTNYLYGGGGNDVIVGGSGTNFIWGGSGRNLLIGGGGGGSPNYILGSIGDNIEISGTTSYDCNQAALCAILQEWDSGDSYNTRVQKITQTGLNVNGSTVKLNSTTIQRAAAYEYLFGGIGQNLYFANETGSFFDRDYVIGRKWNEMILPN
jgi:uncharacterized repeat protein (TIGR01451 family)